MRTLATQSRRLIGVAIVLALSAGAGPLAAQGMITVAPPPPAEAATERPVTFSAAQADSGQGVYERYCVMCHGANLNDGEFGGPPLRGTSFEESWAGLPVSALYGYIEAAMPPDNPGALSQQGRTDVVAYLLSRNGYAEGAPLPGDLAAFDLLMLER